MQWGTATPTYVALLDSVAARKSRCSHRCVQFTKHTAHTHSPPLQSLLALQEGGATCSLVAVLHQQEEHSRCIGGPALRSNPFVVGAILLKIQLQHLSVGNALLPEQHTREEHDAQQLTVARGNRNLGKILEQPVVPVHVCTVLMCGLSKGGLRAVCNAMRVMVG
jgi:hypothetical protein